jgi:hypothetical protein
VFDVNSLFRNVYNLLPTARNKHKPEVKRPLGRPRRRRVNNIKMDLREIGCDGMDWIDMDHDREKCRALVNTVLNLRVP